MKQATEISTHPDTALRREAPTGTAARILLADDDAEMRSLMAWALERQGYILQECHDGESLLKWIERSHSRSTNVRFDLVISDIRMPGATGLEVLEEVKTLGGQPDVILVSAFCDPRTKEKARRLGAAALLPKPFEVEDLVAGVQEVLEARDRASAGTAIPAVPEEEKPLEPTLPVELTFRHTDSSDEIREFVREQAARLERHADHLHRCRVVIEALEGESDLGYRITLIASRDGSPLVAEVDTEPDSTAQKLKQGLRHAFATVDRRVRESKEAAS